MAVYKAFILFSCTKFPLNTSENTTTTAPPKNTYLCSHPPKNVLSPTGLCQPGHLRNDATVRKFFQYNLSSDITHGVFLLDLINSQLLKDDTYGNDDKSWVINNYEYKVHRGVLYMGLWMLGKFWLMHPSMVLGIVNFLYKLSKPS